MTDAEKKAGRGEGESEQKMISLEILTNEKNIEKFSLKGVSAAYCNTLRKMMLNYVPVMAIENVEFRDNSSALFDEIVAHRLGLIPLKTDLKSYELPKSEKDISDKKALCTVTLTLKEKGPKMVKASDMKSNDPKITPVYENMPIVNLLKGQKLEFIATAVLGQGFKHAKWSPCHVYYTAIPNLTISEDFNLKKAKEIFPSVIFDSKNKIKESLILKHNLIDAVAHLDEDIIKVEYSQDNFIFHLESWGNLTPKEIFEEGLKQLQNKLIEFDSELKKV